MSLFEIILVALLGVYILSNLYIAISGMILKIKKKTENEELKKKLEESKKTTREKKETEE